MVPTSKIGVVRVMNIIYAKVLVQLLTIKWKSKFKEKKIAGLYYMSNC